MQVEELKKQLRAIDLSLAACRKRQSPRTGFVHLFAADETAVDTIPLYENFCFAFALFRQKTGEAVLEGKQLLERLFAFQTESGNFPTYLHDFPRAWDHSLPLKIAPLLIHLLRSFGSVLGTDFKEVMESVLAKCLKFAVKRQEEKPYSFLWEQRLNALLGQPLTHPETDCFSAQDWSDWIVTCQIAGQTGPFPIPYNNALQAFLGPVVAQEKGEPRPEAIEWILADGDFTPRLLVEHPGQIAAVALLPFTTSSSIEESVSTTVNGLIWKGNKLHSLYAKREFDLPAGVEIGKELLFEAGLFVDLGAEIFINGQKGTVFRLGDLITIQTLERKIDCRFELVEGEGSFCGHILRANRPNQTACKGPLLYETFDWQVGVRTLRRSGACKIKLSLQV